ncbi:hypothetical protein GCM10010492_33590 [Saccharothrix mutabilis subsp. mutabilis]|uniref:Uncharacterized protein n=1 Tax=Saccharothrix mutabilis subsp. mutabilis TaxID=66855 RepID=A0ABN0TX07_9PSEU
MLDRRTFVLGAAVTAVAATSVGTAHAAAPPAHATGAASLGGTPVTLARIDGRWALLGDNGSVRITTGLDNADLVDLADDGTRLVAAGSLAGDPVAALWTSTDGVTWHEARRLHGTRSEFTAVTGTLALGSVVRHERAAEVRVAVRRTASGWTTTPVRGLADGLLASALATTPGGFVCASVDSAGTRVHTSADGVAWSELPRVEGVAVRGLVATSGAVRWFGNEIAGSAPLTGVVGGSPSPAAVPADAKALGVTGARSAWLSGGRLLTTAI